MPDSWNCEAVRVRVNRPTRQHDVRIRFRLPRGGSPSIRITRTCLGPARQQRPIRGPARVRRTRSSWRAACYRPSLGSHIEGSAISFETPKCTILRDLLWHTAIGRLVSASAVRRRTEGGPACDSPGESHAKRHGYAVFRYRAASPSMLDSSERGTGAGQSRKNRATSRKNRATSRR